MPIGTRFSKGLNDEPIYPVELIRCDLCNLAQLSYCAQSTDITLSELLQDRSPPNLGDVRLQTNEQCNKTILVIDGVVREEICYRRESGERIISLETFLVQMAGTAVATGTCKQELGREVVLEFRKLFGRVDEILVNNLTKCAHPFHISNVTQLPKYLGNLSELLAASAKIVVRAPMIGEIIKSGAIEYIYHEHQNYFCISSLARLFSLYDLNLIRARPIGDGVNAEVIFGLGPTNELDLLELAHYRRREEQAGLWESQTFQGLLQRMERARFRLGTRLANTDPSKCAGFGASVAGIATMYQFGLSCSLSFLLDDNPQRVGMFCPESNLVVRSPVEVELGDLEATVILVPMYSEAIENRHGQKLGQVLIPRIRINA